MNADTTRSPLTSSSSAASPPASMRSISARRVAVGTAYNLTGLGLPLIVALALTPYLIHILGLDRYAVLSIMWVIIGYASLFDLGIGRSLTKIVAEKLGAGQEQDVPGWTAAGLVLLAALGTLGTVMIVLVAGPLFGRFVKVPANLQAEVIQATRVMAIAIPFVVLSAGLRGIVEAYQDFRATNVIRSAMGIYLVICPLFTVPWNPSLVYVAATLAAGRALFMLFYFRAAVKHVPELRSKFLPDWTATKPLLRFGGWLTVSSTISPFMVSFDRLIIGAVLSITVVAYYATAVDLVTRMLVVVSAMSIVLFPMFSSTLAGAPDKAKVLYKRSIASTKTLMFPLTFFTVLFAELFLRLWLGSDFADNATLPLQILAIGVFANSQANSPLNVVQGSGRPDITAKMTVVELPIYVALLWLMTSRFGIVGSALVWSGRMMIDMLILAYIAQRFTLGLPLNQRRDVAVNTVVTLLFAFAFLQLSTLQRVGYAIVGLSIFGACAWMLLLSDGDRVRLVNVLRHYWPNRGELGHATQGATTEETSEIEKRQL